jgi:putative tricarboxylic transport membrane protein
LPLVLGLVLGGMVERNYRRSVELSYGDHWIFVQDPIAATLLGLAAVLVLGSVISNVRKARAAKTREGSAAA